MCWISNQLPIKNVALEDIPVFKVMILLGNSRLISKYYSFEYRIGETYSMNNDEIILHRLKYGYIIEEGFHSYSSDSKIEVHPDMMEILNARDMCVDRMSIYSECTYVKVECIIPKGSEYYVNKDGEYVSNNIKIIDYNVLERCKNSAYSCWERYLCI